MKQKPIKTWTYTNENPPINNPLWRYDSHTDVMARFKAQGWKPPTKKKTK